MAEKLKGIVLKSNDKKEKDASVLLFSLEQGKVYLTLRGVKNPKAKMKIAQNPFTFGEFIVEEGKSGKIVTGFECIESFHEIAENIDKYFEASAILEIVDKLEFSTDKERADVFVLVIKSLKTICFSENVRSCYVLDKFLIELFKLSGFPLYSDKCTCCNSTSFDKLYINYQVGELVCSACRGFMCEELPKTSYMALKILNSTPLDNLKTIRLASGSEKELLKILIKNFEVHFSCNLKLIGILS